MQPAARLAAALELLESIEAAWAAHGAPADVLVQDYFRARRYAGSKDRRAVNGMVYAVLRARELYIWAAGQMALPVKARSLLILHLCHQDSDSLALFGGEESYSPAAFDAAEQDAIPRAAMLDWTIAPQEAKLNMPAWAQAGFEKRCGKSWPVAAAALAGTAPLDVRLNAIKVHDGVFEKSVKNDLQGFEKTKYSPIGYRSEQHVNLADLAAYRNGMIEVQDEAAQLASLLVGAKPGFQVLDLCAGAGGKSLTIAGTMANKGQIHACDIAGGRLNELKHRAQRANVRNIQTLRLPFSPSGREKLLAPHAGKMDRVLADVPCTGSGTWRRNPDQRWRFDETSLTQLTDTQLRLLSEGAGLVKVGGRLLYMTCSALPAENEDVVGRFLATDGAQNWQLIDYRSLWAEAIGGHVPESLALMAGTLQLMPHAHQTDGFFVAVLERLA